MGEVLSGSSQHFRRAFAGEGLPGRRWLGKNAKCLDASRRLCRREGEAVARHRLQRGGRRLSTAALPFDGGASRLRHRWLRHRKRGVAARRE